MFYVEDKTETSFKFFANQSAEAAKIDFDCAPFYGNGQRRLVQEIDNKVVVVHDWKEMSDSYSFDE